MAPMLRRKSFPLAKPLTEPLKPGEEAYTIEHSKESFRDKEEYEARLQLYGMQIWTCKSTGKSKLTHKEAWDQEQKVSIHLEKKFQSCFEKPLLGLIHHSMLALEQLVDEVYREIMTKYFVDEECNFVDETGKIIQVTIIKVFPPEKAKEELTEKQAESVCDISSVDKGKTNQMGSYIYIKQLYKEEESGLTESQKDGLSEQVLHSPSKQLTSFMKEVKKFAPTKFLPPTYDVKLKNEGKIISSVPAKSLYRLDSPPNKVIVRYFIRHYALRIGIGENAHWEVEDELVKRHSLPSKYSDLLEDSGKYMMLNYPPCTEIKKRKRLNSEKKPPSKMKAKKDDEKKIKDKKQKKCRLIISQSLWNKKHVNGIANTTQLKINNNDSPLSPTDMVANITNVISSNKFDPESSNCVLPEVLLMEKKLESEKAKNLNGQTSSGKFKVPKKNMKNPQTDIISLVDLSNDSPEVYSPTMITAESQQTSRKLQKDASSIVFDLIAYYRDNKDNKDRKTSLSNLMIKAARLLSNDDLALLPEELRVSVEKRRDKMEYKQKLASMTEDQRKEFLREKHNELKEKMREKAKQRRQKEIQEKAEKQQCHEDQDLSGKSLPTFNLLKTPEQLPTTVKTSIISLVDLSNGSPEVSRSTMITAESQQTARKVQKDASSIVFDLIACYRDNKNHQYRKTHLSNLMTKAARLLSNDNLALLPEELRVLVEKRREKMEYKQKLASMTEDQRKEFLREKHNKLKAKMREKAKQRRKNEIQEKVKEQWCYEDQDLSGKSLPIFNLLKTPEQLPTTVKTNIISFVDLSNGSPEVSSSTMITAESQKTSRKVQKNASSIVFYLNAYYRDNKDRKDRKTSLSNLMTKAARLLSNDNLDLLPEDLRVLLEKKRKKMEYKQKLVSMTQDQRKEFLREKHNELKVKIREKAKQRRQKEIQEKVEKQQRYEDQDMSGKSLPTFKLVKTPEQIPTTVFGDVVMVVEFLNCYTQLLTPDQKYPVNAITLMEALTAGSGGFLYLNRVLMTLLHILLQDEIAKDYAELGVKMSEIPLTLHSVSELVRLSLNNSEAKDGIEESFQGDSSEDSKDSASFELEYEFLPKLKTSEYYDLPIEDKLNILVALCHRILETHSVHDHIEEQQQRFAKLTKEQQAMKKVVNNKVKKKKVMDKEPCTEVMNREADENGANTDGEENDARVMTKKQIDLGSEDVEDVLSGVKGQRTLLMQNNIEEEEQDSQLKDKMEMEAKEAQVENQKPLLEKTLQESIARANLVLRRSPLGTDRNHNRYWLFTDAVPGLFIESGWIHESMNYTCLQTTNKLMGEYDPDPEDTLVINGTTNAVDTSAHSGTTETSVPKAGDNLWFICDTQKELDQLLDCLHPQGVRESELKDSLTKRYQDIVNSINLAQELIPELKDCDGKQELLYHLRTDIIDLAKRLYKAGLGYFHETANFEAKMNSIENLKDFGDHVIALQTSVGKSFLQGFMAREQKAQPADATVKTKNSDEKKITEEANVSSEVEVEKWKGAIRNAKTFSRMHMLLRMLDVCIRWDMSSENARCKLCSRKGGDDQLILCDKCNKAFHFFCLRPALYVIPDGEWLCPVCQPSTAKPSTHGGNYIEDSTEEEDGKNEDSTCQSSTARRHSMGRYFAEDCTEAEDKSDEESSEDENDSDYEVEDNEEEEDDYPELTERQLRSMKDRKAMQRRTRSECRGQTPKKKRKMLTDESSLHLAAPVNEANRDDLVNENKSTQPQNRDLRQCQYIINRLINYRFSWPFREPLLLEGADNYMEVDINPVDFITILSKCTCNMYHTVHEFLEDIKLVFNNAQLHNPSRDHLSTCIDHTEKYLVVLLQKHLPGHSYDRSKHRKRTAKRLAPISDEEDSEGSTSAMPNHRME